VVFTQPDRPTGRGRKVRPSPVKQLALAHDIDVRQPRSLKQERLDDDELDVLVVAAYGLLLPKHVLDAPRFGCINVHASLLPRWRGAAPVERAIMAGDRLTGVTIMQMDEGLDTGPTFARAEITIEPSMTGPELEARLAESGAVLLRACLDRLGEAVPEPQSGVATYAAKLTPADAVMDWHRNAADIVNQVRALRGRMPVTCRLADARVRILTATVAPPGQLRDEPGSAPPGTIVAATKSGILVRCGDGAVRIEELQLDRGKGKPVSAASALNGYPELFAIGNRFH
jgi:methionyl-tRNA formyltransferase